MSAASDQITEYLSVGGLFNPEMMNQTQHEAVRDTLIKARDDIQRLERENAALRDELKRQRALWQATHALGFSERDFAIKCIETALARKEAQP